MDDTDSPFVATSGHQEPPVQELERILDLYDEAVADRPSDDELVQLEAREQFILDYNAARESVLRGALEEVAWRLETRGHHAWLEDEGGQPAADIVEQGGATMAPPQALSLRIVPGHRQLAGAEAPFVRFTPDPDRRLVDVHVWTKGPAGPSRRVGPGLEVRVLDEATIIGLAVPLVASVLMDGLGPRPVTPAAPAAQGELPAPVEQREDEEVEGEAHQWASSGLPGPESAPRPGGERY